LPRVKKLLPVSAGAGYPAFRIGRAKRRKLEQAIGQPIPAAAWDEIIVATREYRADTELERNTPPISPVIDRVEKLRAAAAVICAIWEESVSDKRRTPYLHIRADKLRAWALDSRHRMQDFDAELRTLGRIKAEGGGFRAGEAWDRWIRRLTRILEKAGLPTGARNDSDQSRTSPFVAFIRGLQGCLPAKFKRHTFSNPALAKAIERGRASISGRINSIPENYKSRDLSE
jgi:hypothetical protein